MAERLTVSMQGGVADVRLNRAEKINALDQAMFSALVETGKALLSIARCARWCSRARDAASAPGSTSPASCRWRVTATPAGSLLRRDDESPANVAQRAAWVWTEVPVPVIAAVHGVAFGGGLQIALAADIRIAAPDAQLSVMEVKWGLIPDMSGTQTLRRLVRLDVAKELTFTGRIVSGEEGAGLGLVTRVADDPRAAAMQLAHEIATKSPDAIRAGKQLLDQCFRVGVEEGLRLEEQPQRNLIGSANQVEAVQANIEKRAPEFRDPV